VLEFWSAFLVALVATGLTIPLLRRAQVLDVPNHRSSHVEVTPRGGGIGVAVGVAVGVALGGTDHDVAVVLVGSALAALIGLVDDLRGLHALARLGTQFLLAVGVVVLLLAGRDEAPVLLVLGGAVAVVWLVGCLNAFNFMDGVNAISGLTAAVCGGWYAWLGHDLASSALQVAGLALAGAALGFLPWNALRARVFLGDVGSYGIGFGIGGLALVSLLDGASWVRALAPFAIYLADTAWTLVDRVRRGETWHEAHREHVYQRLVIAGWSHQATAVMVAGLALLVCLLAGWAPPLVAAAGAAVVMAVYVCLPRMVAP
jgi:UDP-N-acetylmuramyl pentapeptide phosphotransferase/UDP-N-acetylglucosamine-1-phosphate transferase